MIDTFFQNMGAASGSFASVFAVDAQYTDAANQHADYASTFQGAYTDTDPYPTSGNCTRSASAGRRKTYPGKEPAAITCLTNTQIETELKPLSPTTSLPTGMGTIFYLLTPPGVTVCLDAEGRCPTWPLLRLHKAYPVSGSETKARRKKYSKSRNKKKRKSYETTASATINS